MISGNIDSAEMQVESFCKFVEADKASNLINIHLEFADPDVEFDVKFLINWLKSISSIDAQLYVQTLMNHRPNRKRPFKHHKSCESKVNINLSEEENQNNYLSPIINCNYRPDDNFTNPSRNALNELSSFLHQDDFNNELFK